MGHKVHPKGFRLLGTVVTWPSRWFARGDAFRANLREDVGVRDFFRKSLKDAGVNVVRIERSRGSLTVTVETAKPGIAIGRGEGGSSASRRSSSEFFPGKKRSSSSSISSKSRPFEATLAWRRVSADLSAAWRSAASSRCRRARVRGWRPRCEDHGLGRLNGAEIARRAAHGKRSFHQPARRRSDFATGDRGGTCGWRHRRRSDLPRGDVSPRTVSRSTSCRPCPANAPVTADSCGPHR